MDPVKIQLVANSGVMVGFDGIRILIDGIYGRNRYFSPPQKEMQKAVFGMSSVYRDIDFLLYTHRHTDHFDAAYADEYAVNNQVKAIIVPRAGMEPDSFLEDRRPLPKAAEKGVLREVHMVGEDRMQIPLSRECSARYLRTQHLDCKSYAAVEHCAVLLELGEKKLLFAADADGCEKNRERFSALGHLTAMFVTPLFLLHPDGRHMLESLLPEQVVLYHIPFQQDDCTGLRSMVEKELDQPYPFRLTALMEPEQVLQIST